ncbi:Stress response kinase A [compost metagenome]
MDYTKCFKEVLLQYSFTDPIVELIRHNENITYKLTEKGSEETYLLRMHKPITKNMQGVQNTREAILSELEYLITWSSHSELPVQNPVPNQNDELVTTVIVEDEEVHCSVLKWIFGETMSKQDFNSEETVNTFGTNIANLHRFSLSYQHGSCFMRPEYGIEWTNTMLTKLRLGEEIGIITSREFHIIKNTFSLINARMKEWNKTKDTWGFIHADINYSNLILTSKGISFIDFGLSGFGYYMMDVAMGALMTKGELRDALLSGYTNIISKRVDIEQLEAFMFLAIVGYYTFIVSQKNKHKWIRENISGLIEHLCKPFLNGQTVFYNI